MASLVTLWAFFDSDDNEELPAFATVTNKAVATVMTTTCYNQPITLLAYVQSQLLFIDEKCGLTTPSNTINPYKFKCPMP
jgi:hypothetical protein